jgi:4-hydroxy-3-polyprenylbenzoate decarboxylase
MTQRLIIALSGASGQIYGVRLLEILRHSSSIETHVVMSQAAAITMAQETSYTPKDVATLADVFYRPSDIGAAIASGSFDTMGMIVAPCSIKSLSSIAYSYDADLITRAADVQLKEGRPVLLVVRETPLHLGHLRLMMRATEIGCTIFPPVPAFYSRPRSIDEMVDNTCGRILARIGVPNDRYQEWLGLSRSS